MLFNCHQGMVEYEELQFMVLSDHHPMTDRLDDHVIVFDCPPAIAPYGELVILSIFPHQIKLDNEPVISFPFHPPMVHPFVDVIIFDHPPAIVAC